MPARPPPSPRADQNRRNRAGPPKRVRAGKNGRFPARASASRQNARRGAKKRSSSQPADQHRLSPGFCGAHQRKRNRQACTDDTPRSVNNAGKMRDRPVLPIETRNRTTTSIQNARDRMASTTEASASPSLRSRSYPGLSRISRYHHRQRDREHHGPESGAKRCAPAQAPDQRLCAAGGSTMSPPRRPSSPAPAPFPGDGRTTSEPARV